MPETLEGAAASFIFSLALVSAAEAEVCFLPTVGANGSCSGSSDPDPDKCPTGYIAYASKPDCGIGKKAEQSGTVNGKGCYKCVDETSSDCSRGKLEKDLGTCVDGKTKKEVGSTNSGLKCYECVDDVCPSPYANTEAEAGCNSVTSYPAEASGTTKPSGEPCYECKTCSKGEHYESKPSDNCHDYTKVDNEPCWTKTFSSYANSDSSCPTGMQLDPCGEGETQTATGASDCGKTCYKCEASDNNQICIKFDLFCNGQKCSPEQIKELNAKDEFNSNVFQIAVNDEALLITEDTKICDEPEKMLKEYEIYSSVTKDSSLGSWRFENSLKEDVYQPTKMEGEEYLTFKKINDKYHAVSWWQASTECESIDDNDDYRECMKQRYDNGTGEPLVDNTYTYRIDLRKAGDDERCIYYKVKCYHLPVKDQYNTFTFYGGPLDPPGAEDQYKAYTTQYNGWSSITYGNKWAKDCVEIVGNVSSSGDASRVNQKFPLTQMTEAELSYAAYGDILDNSGYAFDEEGQIVDAETWQPVDIQWTDQQKFFQIADDEVVLKSCDFQEWDTVQLTVRPISYTKVTDSAGKNFSWGGYILNNDQCKNFIKGKSNGVSCNSEENISFSSDRQYNNKKPLELYPYVYLTAPVSVQIKEGGYAVLSWKLVVKGHPLPTNLKLDANTMVLETYDGHSGYVSGSFGNDGIVSKGAWESYFSYSGATEFEVSTSYTQNEAEERVSGNATSVKVVVDDESENKHDINITEGEPFKANMPNQSEDYEGDNYIYLFGKGIRTN